jgi:hypothetical protein
MREIQICLSVLDASHPSSSSTSHGALHQEPTGFEIFRQAEVSLYMPIEMAIRIL